MGTLTGSASNAIAPGIFPTEAAGKRLAPAATRAGTPRRSTRCGARGKWKSFRTSPPSSWRTAASSSPARPSPSTAAACLVNGGSFNELFGLTDADWEKARAAIKAQNEKDKAQRSV